MCSPNYPRNHDNSLDIEYVMTGPPGDTLTISFSAFDVEYSSRCSNDWVEIYEGEGTTGTVLLSKTCGSRAPSPVTSTTNMATLIFHTDSSDTKSGFEAQLSAGVSFTTTTRVNRLKNLLTDRCWVDCELNKNYVSNPACLLDCFPAGHCLTSLLLDYTGAGGVCGGSFTSQYYPGLWPSSDRTCTFLQETDQHFTAREDYQIKTGICSAETEALLLDQEKCILPLYSQTESILVSLQTLIWSSCSWETCQAWKPIPTTTTTTSTTTTTITSTTVRSIVSDPLQAFHQGTNPNNIGKKISVFFSSKSN